MDTLNIGINKPEKPKDGKGVVWGSIAIIVVIALLIYFVFLRGAPERTAPPALTEEEKEQVREELSLPPLREITEEIIKDTKEELSLPPSEELTDEEKDRIREQLRS